MAAFDNQREQLSEQIFRSTLSGEIYINDAINSVEKHHTDNVVVVVGLPGEGKSTLASAIYGHNPSIFRS